MTPRFAPARFLLRGLSIAALGAIALASTTTLRTFSAPAADTSLTSGPGKQTAVLAGGCFWGVEAVFEHVKGVSTVVSGYSGGNESSPTYETVSSGRTGHAEVVKITYDPSQVSYNQLLKLYFLVAHNPTELNRQGPDTGTQYRSAIFYTNNEQKKAAEVYIDQLNKARVFNKPIVTQIAPLKNFQSAEDYHQNFIARNPYYPYVVVHDLPKLEQLRKQFPALYKQ